jgi:cell division protein FtsQ
VQRERGRKRLHRVVALGALVALSAIAYGVTRTPLLAVQHVRVSGGDQVRPAAIQAASGIRNGAPMLDVSTGAAARRIEQLPWVADASVQRKWPRTIVIKVAERQPAAQLADGKQWLVVDLAGRVLERRSSSSSDLATVVWQGSRVAPGSTLAVPAALLRLADALPTELREAPATVSLDGSLLVVNLPGGAVIRVGDTTALRDKLVAAVTLLETPAAHCAAVIDVQVPTAPTLTTKQGCA